MATTCDLQQVKADFDGEVSICRATWAKVLEVALEQQAVQQQLVAALQELYTLVKGECPSLLNEDSGGDARIDFQVQDALAAAGAA